MNTSVKKTSEICRKNGNNLLAVINDNNINSVTVADTENKSRKALAHTGTE